MSGGAPRTARGFTLVELAVVVAIVGLLLGGLLLPLTTQVEITRARSTEKQVADLRDALYGFAVASGRLPCPDTDGDGRENLTAGNCSASQGQPPWADLGTDQTDSWSRPFVYRVDTTFADATDGTGCPTPTAGVSFSLCSVAALGVYSSAPASCPTPAPAANRIAANVPAVFLSQGPNGGDSSAFSAEELENNSAADLCYVDKDYESGFDDLVSWLSPHVLKALMVRAERLP